MKYTITINQKACIDMGLDLDIVDMAILDVVSSFANSTRCKKKIVGNNIFYYFHYSLIVKDLPIIGINNRTSIYNRFKKLQIAQIIIPHINNQSHKESYFAFGPNYDLIYGSVLTKVNTSVNESLHNYNTNYNTKEYIDYSSVNYKKHLAENRDKYSKDIVDGYEAMLDFVFGNNDFKQPFTEFLAIEHYLTLEQYKKLSEASENGLGWILEKMLNKPSYLDGKKSIFLVLRNWIEREKEWSKK